MNKVLVDKLKEGLASKDEEKIEEFKRSEEFLQVKNEFEKTWNRIKSAIQSYYNDNINPVLRYLVKAKKENDHYIRYSSYKKKKSQRKNWKKWRKKR